MGIDFAEIKRRRESAGLSLQSAADAAGFSSRQFWWQIENGRKPGLTVDSLTAVARVLSCKLDDLIEPEKPKRQGTK
jgi:transcriptional regulator with XRE-family HTH domain